MTNKERLKAMQYAIGEVVKKGGLTLDEQIASLNEYDALRKEIKLIKLKEK
jgi:hypothetical protein|tara:strand:+ start:907 stop:1059 length:153 start_codon:yes stop_codon:yes gene_type:complete